MFQEIWPTCDQFLNMMTGSEYEHALLLTNFFASIGKKSFLVLGQVGKNLIWTEVFYFGSPFENAKTFFTHSSFELNCKKLKEHLIIFSLLH